ncbi:CYTH-like domain-containing protein [Parachaetomium inaequale]|uniref:mRNA-capping enzyme subunit beta n=1 Tax=Parachaetomium inaequale TaxID=2588326 RepID=A0AAN6SP47_9PEZI|nr:CYTH-like domain-containing protein [Parachaetomium inaequale]
MDLRGMLNDNVPSAAPPSKPPPPPPQQPAQQPALPSTPVQTNPQQSFRDYSQTQPSPGRHISQDYGAHHMSSGPFASPPPFQAPPAGSYPGRPPPQLQQVPSDLRSPSLGPGPVPSPYRQTPAASLSSAGGYPFPPQQNPTSPVQRHQYPPTGPYHRDSYPQPAGPVGMTGPPAAAGPYMQGSHIPQTPPIVTPGTGHPFLHRTQSMQSSPTPTSAHSQSAQYGAPFVQGSPVAAARPLQPADPYQRQSSQPPTPGGTMPLSARPAQVGGYGPPSPYQQRLPGPGPGIHPTSQTSPPPPPAPSLPRHSSSQSIHDSHSQDSARGPQPASDRDRSLSVSPKTRVPSLPSSSGRPGTSVSEQDPYFSQPHSAPTMAERAATPAKRKLDDRELRPDELEKREVRPPPFEGQNGRPTHSNAGAPVQRPAIPVKGMKSRKVYREVPGWAQSLRDRAPAFPNRVLYQPIPHSGPQANGKPDRQPDRQPARPERMESRQASPEEKRTAARVTPAPSVPPEAGSQWGLLGPWEASITNSLPQEQFSKEVADFFFQYVILNEDINEIQSRGVKFEIEAKLGILIDKSTNQRVELPVRTECVLSDSGNWLGFRSSMTELQHRSFNEFLNALVQQTHPANKAANAALPRPRLPIDYRHRRETDKFFELPASVRDRSLPVCVAKPIAAKGHGVKVRVSYDQKTNKVIGKIVKARIADLSLHFPDLPLDCRISVNLEMDWDGSVEELEKMAAATGRPPIPPRMKDRLSYKHGCYQIDLTQVTQNVAGGTTNPQRAEKDHELEVEIDPVPVIEQGRRAMEGQPHQYVEVVDGLVNNIRILARKAKEFGG